MFINGLIPFPIAQLAALVLTNRDIIKESIKWADKRYKDLCNNNQMAVAILYLQGKALYRSLIVAENGNQHRYDDTRSIVDNYKDLDLDSDMDESLTKDGYIVIKKY